MLARGLPGMKIEKSKNLYVPTCLTARADVGLVWVGVLGPF